MSVEVGSVGATLSLDDKFIPVLQRAGREMQRISAEITVHGKKIADTGELITRKLSAITVPVAAAGVVAVKWAADFETSFAGVRKTVNASEAEFAQLEKGIRELAKNDVPIDVNKLNAVAEAAGQLGIAKENIIAFTKTMAQLEETTNLTADQAASVTAQFQNIFGAAGREIDRLGSTLVALGNAGASTESQILDMGLRLAGVGKQIGLTQGETLAFASTLSSLGINAEAGGTALSKVMGDIAVAVSTNSRELKNFAAVAGRSTSEFAELFRNNAAQAIQEFITGLGRMKENQQDVLLTLEQMGITEERMRNALLATSGAGQLLTDQLRLQGEAWADNNALTKEAEERHKTLHSQLQFLRAEIKDAGITLGQSLLPVIKDLVAVLKPLAEGVGRVAEIFAKIPQPIRIVAISVIGLAAAAGPAVIIYGKLVESMGIIVANSPRVAAAITSMLGPWGLLAAAIIGALLALNAWIVKVRDEMQTEIENMVNGANRIGEAWSDLKDLQAAGGNVTSAQLQKMSDDLADATTAAEEASVALDKFLRSRGKTSIEQLGQAEKNLGAEIINNASATENRRRIILQQLQAVTNITDAEEEFAGKVNITTEEMEKSTKAFADAVKARELAIKQNTQLAKLFEAGAGEKQIAAVRRAHAIHNTFLQDVASFGEAAARSIQDLTAADYDAAKRAETSQKAWEDLGEAIKKLGDIARDTLKESVSEDLARGLEKMERDARKILDRFDLKNALKQDADFQIRISAVDETTPRLQSIKENFLVFLRELGEGSVDRGEAVFAEMAKRFGWTIDQVEADLGRLEDAAAARDIRGAGTSSRDLFDNQRKQYEDLIRRGVVKAEDGQAKINELTERFWGEQLASWGNALSFLAERFGGFFSALQKAVSGLQQAQGFGQAVGDIASGLGASSSLSGAYAALGTTFAIFALIYDFVDKAIERNKQKRFGSVTEFGIQNGQEIGTIIAEQGSEIFKAIRAAVQTLEDALHISITDLETIGIAIRNDGEKIKAYLAGTLVGVFNTFEEALQATLRAALVDGGATIAGLTDLMREGLAGFTSPDFDELIDFLGKLREIGDLGLSQAAIDIRDSIANLDDLWEAIHRVGQATPAVAQGFNDLVMGEARLWQSFFDSITGRERTQAEILAQKRQELEVAKIELQLRKATIAQRIVEIQATIAAIKAGRQFVGGGGGGQGGSTGIAPNGGIFSFVQAATMAGVAIAGATSLITASTVVLSDAALAMIAALEGELDALQRLLDALPEPPDISDIRLPGGGGGSRGGADQVQDFIRNKQFELSLRGLSDYARRLAELNRQYDEQAAQLGNNSARLAELIALREQEIALLRQEEMQRVIQNFQQFLGLVTPFDQVRNTAAQLIEEIENSPFGDERKMRMIGRIAAELERQLNRLAQETTVSLFSSLIQDLQRAGVEESKLTDARKAMAFIEHQLRMDHYRAQIAILRAEGRIAPEVLAQITGLLQQLEGLDPNDFLGGSGDKKSVFDIARERARERIEEAAQELANRIKKANELLAKYTEDAVHPITRALKTINADFTEIISALGATPAILEAKQQAIARAIDQFLEPLREARRNQQLGSDSPLSIERQWQQIQDEMAQARARLAAGDLTVISDGARIYEDFIRILREITPAGTEGFNFGFERAEDFLDDILSLAPQFAGGSAGVSVAGIAELTALSELQNDRLGDIADATAATALSVAIIANRSQTSAIDGVL